MSSKIEGIKINQGSSSSKWTLEELDSFDYDVIEDDIDINDYFDPVKLEQMKKEYAKKLKELRKEREKPETLKCGDKVISKAEKKGGKRTCNYKTTLKDDIMKEISEHDLNNQELLTKLKKTIEKLESDAKAIEAQINLTEIKTLQESEIKEARKYLFETKITSVESSGISTDKYVSEITNIKYSTKSQPNESLIDDAAHQLVYISRLSKQLGIQLLQQTNVQLKFDNIDFGICMYLKQHKHELPDYKLSYIILQEFFKKLIVVNLSNVEGAFRSKTCWIKPEFKKMIIKDVVMLQSLPNKLTKSWKIFINELCKTDEPHIFNDVSKLDYVVHLNDDYAIETILAQTIKCMTPCFIFNYYNVIKSVYLMCGLINDWLDKQNKIKSSGKEFDILKMYSELINISKVCVYLYQNTRLFESGTSRNLPYTLEPMSEELQMYYLNHTVVGPQHILLKGLEKYILGII